jgi:fluoride exporter
MEAQDRRTADEPTDPVADLPVRARRRETARDLAPVLATVAVGGLSGACARYAATLIWPTTPDAFPWTTFGVNVVGCTVIGVFMVLITDLWTPHRLVRPFFGTGVLGGFTTFSAYAVDIQRLVSEDRARTAVAYLGLTPAAALAAVWCAAWLTRRVVMRSRS